MAIDPKVQGAEGDNGMDGLWEAITDTLGGLVRDGGDYLHEKFLTPKEWDGQPTDTQSVRGKGKAPGNYRGFEFTNIAIIWGVGAAAAIGLIYLAVRKR